MARIRRLECPVLAAIKAYQELGFAPSDRHVIVQALRVRDAEWRAALASA